MKKVLVGICLLSLSGAVFAEKVVGTDVDPGNSAAGQAHYSGKHHPPANAKGLVNKPESAGGPLAPTTPPPPPPPAA